MQVCRLSSGDVAEYRAIRLATLASEPAFFVTPHAEEAARPLEHFAGVLSRSAVFGAFDGREVVGVVRLAPAQATKERHKGSVHGFFVHPDQRRKGAGTALMAALIDCARETLEQLTLTVVAENTGAIALYRRLGFTTYGLEPRALKTPDGCSDMMLMALRLT